MSTRMIQTLGLTRRLMQSEYVNRGQVDREARRFLNIVSFCATFLANRVSIHCIQNPFKRKLFLLLEDPSSSNAAFALNVWVSFAIVLSAVITTIETIPSFRSTDSIIWYKTCCLGVDLLPCMLRFILLWEPACFDLCILISSVLSLVSFSRFDFETVMVAFFTIEFIARVICHSDSMKQLKKFLLCRWLSSGHIFFATHMPACGVDLSSR